VGSSIEDISLYAAPMHVDAKHLVAALREAGMRVTEPRRVVCEIIARDHAEHLTAAAIEQRARSAGTPVTTSTVYRTLEALEEAGVVVHTHLGHGPSVYHLAADPPHQHLVCSRCETATSIEERHLTALFDEITRRTGFVPDASHFGLSGLCERCARGA
jgi:Fur family transcriptional regulator, ferric uptake regulator